MKMIERWEKDKPKFQVVEKPVKEKKKEKDVRKG